MFGEFEDERPSATAADTRRVDEPLWRRIGLHLAAQADVALKSQQRGEPELTVEEKVALAKDLMDSSPSQFLYRFGRFLLADHLAYFDQAAQRDATVAHYLTDVREKLDQNKHKAEQRASISKLVAPAPYHIPVENTLDQCASDNNIHSTRIRNRRWAAVQRLKDNSAASGASRYRNDVIESDHEGYFSEAQMKQRNPLLYQHLVGQHLTAEEINEQKQNFDRSDCRITTIIYDHLDQCYEKELKKKQEEQEDDMFEEDDEETDEEEDEAMEEDGEAAQIEPEHKTLLKEEFLSSMYTSFVSGKDDTFNYKSVDENEEFDLLDVEGFDKEEKYFDEEEPCEASPMCSAPESPALPRLCLDRRVRNDPNFNPEVTAEDGRGPSVQPNTSSGFPSNTRVPSTSDQSLPAVESLYIK